MCRLPRALRQFLSCCAGWKLLKVAPPWGRVDSSVVASGHSGSGIARMKGAIWREGPRGFYVSVGVSDHRFPGA